MPGFIDTTSSSFPNKVREDNFQERFAEFLTNQGGWNKGANGGALQYSFKKVVFDADLLTAAAHNNMENNPKSTTLITIAQHYIYVNNDGKMLGCAVVAQWEQLYSQIESKPFTSSIEQFKEWAIEQYTKYRSQQTLYFYLVEDLRGLDTVSGDICMPFKAKSNPEEREFLRAALDIEVTDAQMTEDDIYMITDAALERMQSPIVTVSLRTDQLEDHYSEDYYHKAAFSNWWPDSEVTLRGFVDGSGFFFVMQCDNVPAPEGNLVPVIPFYFGKLDTEDPDDPAVALFAGSVPPGTSFDKIATYDMDDPSTKASTLILPLLKTYPKYPGNGVDEVIVSRSRYGARYQSYYLSWNAPSNEMPPLREGEGGRDYPRAWRNAENPLYKYAFNPSRYSNKIHTSKIYVVHPEEGVRGSLRNAIGFSALGFNANKLRVKKEFCSSNGPIFDIYRFLMVDGVSPLTRRPGTHYRPCSLGIFDRAEDQDGQPVAEQI